LLNVKTKGARKTLMMVLKAIVTEDLDGDAMPIPQISVDRQGNQAECCSSHVVSTRDGVPTVFLLLKGEAIGAPG
jgi:hypothetical protein